MAASGSARQKEIVDQLTSQEKSEWNEWPEKNKIGAASGALSNQMLQKLLYDFTGRHVADVNLRDLNKVNFKEKRNNMLLVHCTGSTTHMDHWIIVFTGIYPNEHQVFDPAGLHIEDILHKFGMDPNYLGTDPNKWVTINPTIQGPESVLCGQYCCDFVVFYTHADDMQEAVRRMMKLFIKINPYIKSFHSSVGAHKNDIECKNVFKIYYGDIVKENDGNLAFKVLSLTM